MQGFELGTNLWVIPSYITAGSFLKPPGLPPRLLQPRDPAVLWFWVSVSKTRLRNGSKNGTGGYQKKVPTSSVPDSRRILQFKFSLHFRLLLRLSRECSSLVAVCGILFLRNFLFSPLARGAILIVANITTAVERIWRSMRKRPWISYFLFSLKMMMPLATMFVMTKVRVVITPHHHHHHPAMILLVRCRLLHLVVPRDLPFFLSFWLILFRYFYCCVISWAILLLLSGDCLLVSRALSFWLFFGIIFVAYISCAILLLLSDDCLLVPRALSFWFFFGSVIVAYIFCAIDSIAFG